MATTLNLTGLTQGTQYEFRVTAKGDGTTYADSAASTTSNFTTLAQLTTPGTPSLGNRTTNSLTFLWSSHPDYPSGTTYIVSYKATSGSTWSEKTASTSTITLTGLTSGTTYQIKVKATTTTAGYVDSEYSEVGSGKVQTKLATPAVTLSSTTSSITASWGAITNATNYTVEYKLSGASSWTTASQTATTKTLSSLAEGVTYVFRVKATSTNTDYAESEYSTERSATTSTTLAVPTGLALTPTTSTITATWNAVPNASSYTIQYRTGTGSWTTKTSSTASYTITGLTSGTTYAVKVKANGSGVYVDSDYCAESTATVKTKLATPTGLAASNVLSTTATLSWNAVTNATHYLLTISDTNGIITGYNSKQVSGTSIDLTGLTATRQYSVSLIAASTSSDYVSSDAATLEFTTDTKLATPSTPTLTKTTNSITASWGAVSQAQYYTVAYKLSTASTWTESSNISATSFTLSSLAEGVTYDFKVKARTIAEEYEDSDYSATSTTTTLITLATPTGLAVSNIDLTSATLSWNAVEHASKYRVEYRASGEASWSYQDVDN